MIPIKVIKRYENRKLYDTEESRYVTLEDIADLLRANQDVKIVDNKTGEDLTSVTGAQILFEEEKKKKKLLPLPTFKQIIMYGSEFVSGTIHGIEDFQKRMDSRIAEALDKVMIVPRLFSRVKELEKRLAELDKKMKKLRATRKR